MMAAFLNLQSMNLMVLGYHPSATIIAESSLAGYTFCAIAALSLLDRLPQAVESTSREHGLTDLPSTLRWLVSRQVAYDEHEEEDEVGEPIVKLAGVYKDEPLVPDLTFEDSGFVGLNGRCNKAADTCYTFWVSASLSVCCQPLDTRDVVDGLDDRCLVKTQTKFYTPKRYDGSCSRKPNI